LFRYPIVPTPRFLSLGWVAERFKAPVLKTGVGASSPWVRIPPHPHQGPQARGSARDLGVTRNVTASIGLGSANPTGAKGTVASTFAADDPVPNADDPEACTSAAVFIHPA
jgi:hypothetical protein